MILKEILNKLVKNEMPVILLKGRIKCLKII